MTPPERLLAAAGEPPATRGPGRSPDALRRRLLVAAAAAALWPRLPASAADDARYPDRPITLILPSTVGGTSDLLGRLVARYLGEAFGVPVVVEARPGAAGRIALDQAARSEPDGYTLFLANNGINAIVPGGRGTEAGALGKAFAPVTMLARLPIVVVVTPALGVTTLAGLIARARRTPGALSFASSDVGSTSHMAASLLFRRAGVKLVHIPYAGTSSAVRDVLSGEVPVLFTHLGTVAALLRDGRLRALAVTGRGRMAEFPDIETVAEAGYPGFDVTTWHGILVPAGTPPAIVSRLHAALVRIVALPEMQRQLAALGMEPDTGTPAQFAADIAADVRHWAEVLRRTGAATR